MSETEKLRTALSEWRKMLYSRHGVMSNERYSDLMLRHGALVTAQFSEEFRTVFTSNTSMRG